MFLKILEVYNMKAIPSRRYSAKAAQIEAELSERYPRKHIFQSNFPEGFGIGDHGERRGTDTTYFLPKGFGKEKREMILSALDVFFDSDSAVAHVTDATNAVHKILRVSGLSDMSEGYIALDIIFGKHRVSHQGKHLFDLCIPADATHFALKAGWLRELPPKGPLFRCYVENLPHKVRRSKIHDPFDAFILPIGGVLKDKDDDRPARIVMNLAAAADVRRFGSDLYRAISDT